MRWNLHGNIIEGISGDATLNSAWQRSYSSVPLSDDKPDLTIIIELVDALGSLPMDGIVYHYETFATYYLDADSVTIHFPDLGTLWLDLAGGVTRGEFLHSITDMAGYLEDIIGYGLSPHLRRRGLFMVHAFAAEKDGMFVLLVGEIGVGKTTSGISLLEAGWNLLSNDSPIIAGDGIVLSYPGVIGAYSDTLSMFDGTKELALGRGPTAKIEFDAVSIWPDIWRSEARRGLILFPQDRFGDEHEFTRLSRAETLGRLLPHSLDSWDKSTEAAHFAALEHLVSQSPSFELRAGRNLHLLPAVLSGLIDDLQQSGEL